SIEMQTAVLSQFLHGEQGALICTGLITATVPWIDAKYYAATQVMDEARHVEVFGRYIDEKTNGAYPISPQLGSLLDDIIADGRWDITYLGMQIMVEGLALAAFGFMHMLTTEPLLKKLLRYVMSDEARHVAFGVLSLKEFYEGLGEAEIRERQEFAYEAAVRLRNRFMIQEVWERLGADPKAVVKFLNEHQDPGQQVFQQMLFSKIVPNAKKLGLLDAGDGDRARHRAGPASGSRPLHQPLVRGRRVRRPAGRDRRGRPGHVDHRARHLCSADVPEPPGGHGGAGDSRRRGHWGPGAVHPGHRTVAPTG